MILRPSQNFSCSRTARHRVGESKSAELTVPLCREEHRLVALALHGAYPNTGLALLVIQNVERRPFIGEVRP